MIFKLTTLSKGLIITILTICSISVLLFLGGNKIIDTISGKDKQHDIVKTVVELLNNEKDIQIDSINKSNEKLISVIKKNHSSEIRQIQKNNRDLLKLRLRNIKNDNVITWIIMFGILSIFLIIFMNSVAIISQLPKDYLRASRDYYIEIVNDEAFIVHHRNSNLSSKVKLFIDDINNKKK